MRSEWLWGLLILMTLFGSFGSACFKMFSLRKKKWILLAGFLLYGIGALLNIYLLRFLPYTVVLPANALTYIWTMYLAKVLFKETIGFYKMAGIAFIFAGLLLLVL
ncbi:EamA family transporter [Paenibacillus apiarius]|uniref:EamA family transporter n=1 Tax=Paenibacillus apiarius TaxID=46240 RepID=A0ABT4DSK3_9BACL|nr:EamA family transporter [Paenibacillus apiarius]MBN3525298.1 EamA family transporter [Paenibacillus apiarius]MCY9513017.1 EamA family transporter [Paenibacillus apiarius]MCY9519001.1 EamA family transporter [Paenibacillus apiarius]MCY9550810.1 EamA family transporter [Paenibacillus apiarius]MCY9559756.1 EamA family transporter [Paenibacillus apiarius]